VTFKGKITYRSAADRGSSTWHRSRQRSRRCP
jgi:hypothetical protein